MLVYGAYGHAGRFVVDVVVRRGELQRRISAAGRDIAMSLMDVAPCAIVVAIEAARFPCPAPGRLSFDRGVEAACGTVGFARTATDKVRRGTFWLDS